ncbi:MAG TPA: LysM peptidoglycan-binding domain-containing protein [Bacteroidales bacterium]|nr:LysM peptidoglycan-binding domain-containing protein [Bacteroidales bacterium]HRZ48034.1 LysM peptidoglycan-binding domain-containing protein [Bacteroidales bacterium]
MNILTRKIWIFCLFAGIQLFYPSGIVSQNNTAFEPFTRSLQGLRELAYVKQGIATQTSRQTQGKISSGQAMKVVKNAAANTGIYYSDRVQELLDFYTSDTVRRDVEMMLGMAPAYLPMFESTLKKEGMPTDLMYLPLALSSLNPRAVSPWGASGLWQLMFTTGKLYNLQIDSYVDERRDPEKSTQAAVAYLKDLYAVYLDWELTIAAYTSGPASVNKAIRKAGGSRKYEEIYPFLPAETREFLPAFTACYVLSTHPDLANLKPVPIEIPNFRQKEPVEKRLHLGQIADALSIPLPLLQDMNPEYKSSIIPVVSKTLWVKLPLDKIVPFNLMGDSIYQYLDTVYFPPSRRINIVAEAPVQPDNQSNTPSEKTDNGNGTSEQTQTEKASQPATPQNKTKLVYTVREGDNLGHISALYDVKVSDIRSWNHIRNDMIKVGQKLDIYVPASKADRYKGIDSKSTDKKQKGNAVTQQPSKSAATSHTIHTVARGETLSGIASKYPGVSADDIMKLNGIKDPRSLQVGQKIKIPKK